MTRPEVEQWKYWLPYPAGHGPRSFVLTLGETIIAHSATVPGVLAWGGERNAVLHAVDWAARAGTTGAGVALMKRLELTTDGLFAIGGSPYTRQLLPHLGFKPMGEVTTYVRTLRPLRMLGGRPRGWRLLPRLARSVLWTVLAPARGRDAFTTRRLSVNTLPDIRPALPTPSAHLAVLERSEDLLRHALDCPLVPMELHVLERERRVQGYFLLAIAGLQARLVDCWMNTSDPADWRALMQCAVQQAKRHAHIAELIAWASDPLQSRALTDCGFHARSSQPLGLMMRAGRTAPAATLRVQMLDTDVAYLDPRGESLLA